MKYLWKAVNQIDLIFEIESKKISDKRYEVKYEILNENGESIEFAIEIYENVEMYTVDVQIIEGDWFEFRSIFEKILKFFGPYVHKY